MTRVEAVEEIEVHAGDYHGRLYNVLLYGDTRINAFEAFVNLVDGDADHTIIGDAFPHDESRSSHYMSLQFNAPRDVRVVDDEVRF